MGTFESYIYSDGSWSSAPTSELYLAIEVQNETFASIDYHSPGGKVSRFYVGIQPKDYFDDEGASVDVDVAAEADGFAKWAGQALGSSVDPASIRELIASEGADPSKAEHDVDRPLGRLLGLIGLELPAHDALSAEE